MVALAKEASSTELTGAEHRSQPSTGLTGRERERFSITLSPSAAKAFHELKTLTDADTDSEVFRNALRLHISLVRAYRDGKKIYLETDGDKSLIPVNLFAPVD